MLKSKIVKNKGPHTLAAPGRKRQVLVVDDNKAVQDVLSRLLSFLGYGVTLAGNGLEGGTLFLTGSFDLVVTDVHMPLMNGWELSRLIKERSPKTPVIVVTGFSEDQHWNKVDKSCVDAIIPKPFKLNEFDTTVQRLLNSGT